MKAPTENEIQCAVVALLRWRAPNAMYFAVPNGENRDPWTGARLKAQGVRRGVPDLVFILPDGTVRFLEMKAQRGSLSKDQRAWRDACEAIGVPYAVARSVDEAAATLTEWGVL